jgi:hypothetical protein
MFAMAKQALESLFRIERLLVEIRDHLATAVARDAVAQLFDRTNA